MSQQPPLRGDHQFRDEVVRIAELTVNTSTLEDYEFSNCRIIGPAILGFLEDLTVVGCTWNAPGLDAIFWEVPPERGPVIGIVAVQRCTFSNCRFEEIGVAGPPDLRPIFEQGFRAAG